MEQKQAANNNSENELFQKMFDALRQHCPEELEQQYYR